MGSASQPMLVIKYNRALLKKRKIKELKELVRKTSGKTALEFKKITPEEMAIVNEKIRAQHRKNIRNRFTIYIISTLLTLALIFSAYLILGS